MEEKEIWKDVVGYEGLYQVSNLGEIKNTTKLLSKWINSNGYYYVSLFKKGKKKSYRINRLVAFAFLGLNINDKKSIIMHKDNNTFNNIVDNLMVGTHKENMQQMREQKRGRCGNKNNIKHYNQIIKLLREKYKKGEIIL